MGSSSCCCAGEVAYPAATIAESRVFEDELSTSSNSSDAGSVESDIPAIESIEWNKAKRSYNILYSGVSGASDDESPSSEGAGPATPKTFVYGGLKLPLYSAGGPRGSYDPTVIKDDPFEPPDIGHACYLTYTDARNGTLKLHFATSTDTIQERIIGAVFLKEPAPGYKYRTATIVGQDIHTKAGNVFRGIAALVKVAQQYKCSISLYPLPPGFPPFVIAYHFSNDAIKLHYAGEFCIDLTECTTAAIGDPTCMKNLRTTNKLANNLFRIVKSGRLEIFTLKMSPRNDSSEEGPVNGLGKNNSPYYLAVRSFKAEDGEAVKAICKKHFRSLCSSAVQYYCFEHFRDLIALLVIGKIFQDWQSLCLSTILFLAYLFIRARIEMEIYIFRDCPDLDDIMGFYMNPELKEKNNFWVAEAISNSKGIEVRKIIGCVGCSSARDDPTVAQLLRLVVAEGARRMRNGSRLLAQFEQFVSQNHYREIRVSTNNLNTNHMKFLRQHGYEATQTISRSLMRGCLIQWKKKLNQQQLQTGDSQSSLAHLRSRPITLLPVTD